LKNQREGDHQTQLPMLIVDVLRYDIGENVTGILELINNETNIGWRKCWSHDFTEQEIISGLKDLLQKKFVRPLYEDHEAKEISDWDGAVDWEKLDSFRFRITELGWKMWEKWNPPKED